MTGKVLVTGGAGFIGSHLVDKLVNSGFDVIVLDNFFSGRHENLRSHFGKPNFCLIHGDVRKNADVRKALKDVDGVFHFAAIVSVDLSLKNPTLVTDVNVHGTLNVLEASLKANVKRIIYASSCAVYGEPIYLPIDEGHPTRPISHYGVSKLAAEHYCRVYNKIYGLETVCLRFFNVYGPRQMTGPYGGVIMNFIDKLRRKESPIIYNNGRQTRDFIFFVKDVVDACISAMHCKNCVGEVINVGSGVETPIYRLVEILNELLRVHDVKPIYSKAWVWDIDRSCADLRKARKLLHYRPRTSLSEGLIHCLESK
ncbi:MAG: SDR family NAD(P)-dependent oxidoreductase [Candidatus Bathyarchaeia archaeon]